MQHLWPRQRQQQQKQLDAKKNEGFRSVVVIVWFLLLCFWNGSKFECVWHFIADLHANIYWNWIWACRQVGLEFYFFLQFLASLLYFIALQHLSILAAAVIMPCAIELSAWYEHKRQKLRSCRSDMCAPSKTVADVECLQLNYIIGVRL